MACYGWGKNDFMQICNSNILKTKDSTNKKQHTKINNNNNKVVKLPKKILIQSKIIKVAVGTKHCLYLDKYGYVWSSGRAVEGQRGIAKNVLQNGDITRIGGELLKEFISDISAGGNMSFAISSSGTVYNWGLVPLPEDENGDSYWEKSLDHTSGKLLVTHNPKSSDKYNNNNNGDDHTDEERQTYLERVKKRSESAYYYNDPSLFNAKDMKASEGVIAMKVKLRKCFEPRKIQSLEHLKCKKIVCGSAHSIALTSDGYILSRGYNDRGQLGLGNRINSPIFQPVKIPSNISGNCIDIACGSDHNIVLGEHNSLWAFGAGSLGQLGLGPKQQDTLTPLKIQFLPESSCFHIKHIACGQYHSVLVVEERANGNEKEHKMITNIYSFGLSEYDIHNINGEGRFRNVRDMRYFFTPRRLQSSILEGKKITGIDCTAHSTIVKTSDNVLYTWGWASSGVLGVQNVRTSGISQIHGLNDIRTFHTGEYNVFAISNQEDGHIHGLKFKMLLNDEIFSDIICNVGGTILYLHSFILSSRCPLFFGNDKEETGVVKLLTKENGKNMYCINVTSRKEEVLYCAIFDYIYSDHCILPKHLIFELAKLALKFNLKNLYARCVGLSATKIEEKIQDSSVLAGKRQMLLDSIKKFGENRKNTLRQVSTRNKMVVKDNNAAGIYYKHNNDQNNSSKRQMENVLKFDDISVVQNENKKHVNDSQYDASSFILDFNNMLHSSNSTNYDVHFECNDDKNDILGNTSSGNTKAIIGAHRAILTTNPYFKSLLCGGFKESSPTSNVAINCPKHIFNALLRWIYTGDENIVNEENALGMLIYAKQFVLDELIQVVEVFVMKNIDESSAPYLIEFSEYNDFQRINKKAELIAGRKKRYQKINK